MTNTCGTGTWTGPQPGDPDNNSVLSAAPAFGGIDISWSYPATNPYAVAHTLLYRGITSDFSLATQIAVVAGNTYYDKLDTGTTYYYWIRIVSVYGTLGATIGPAWATAKPLIQDLLTQLTGQIDAGTLAQALKTEIDKITLNHQDILTEIQNRLSGDSGLSVTMSQVQGNVDSALAAIQTEIGTRASGDSALALQIDTVGAANSQTAALLTSEQTARVSGDNALGLRIDSVEVASQTNQAAIQDIKQAKIGYSAVATGTGAPYDGDGVTVVYPEATYPALDYPEYAVDRRRIIDAVGVTNWNATPAGLAKPLVWLAGMPMATAIKKIGVTGPDGQAASLDTALVAQKDLNGEFKALYTAKVNVNGLVGGFGIYNDGALVEAGFDVDTFWIGRTAANKRKPFIVVDGIVYIDEAAINKLTFSKLRDEAGAFVVENGQVKAAYLDTKGLVIRDAAGNAVFSAGTGLNWSFLTNKPAFAPANADRTADNVAAGIAGQGTLATANSAYIGSTVRFADGSLMSTGDFINRLSRITAANISTFMESAAIGSAFIGNAAVGTAHIGVAQIDTLRVAGNAITTPVAAFTAAAQASLPSVATLQAVAIAATGGPITINAGCFVVGTTGFGAILGTIYLKRDGVILQSNNFYAAEGQSLSRVLPPFVDTPGAGTFTYTLEGNSTSGQGDFSNRGMFVMEVKR